MKLRKYWLFVNNKESPFLKFVEEKKDKKREDFR